MLEYFGFYASPSNPPAQPDEPPPDEVVARATRLADRARHSQPLLTAGPAWESSTSLKR